MRRRRGLFLTQVHFCPVGFPRHANGVSGIAKVPGSSSARQPGTLAFRAAASAVRRRTQTAACLLKNSVLFREILDDRPTKGLHGAGARAHELSVILLRNNLIPFAWSFVPRGLLRRPAADRPVLRYGPLRGVKRRPRKTAPPITAITLAAPRKCSINRSGCCRALPVSRGTATMSEA